MKKKNKAQLMFILLGFIMLSLLNATNSYAATTTCYDFEDEPKFGAFILCVIPQIWTFLQVIFVAIAVILFMVLMFNTIRNRTNSRAMETIPEKWMYLLIFILLAAGIGGTILDIVLKIFGVGSVQNALDSLEKVLQHWDSLAP